MDDEGSPHLPKAVVFRQTTCFHPIPDCVISGEEPSHRQKTPVYVFIPAGSLTSL